MTVEQEQLARLQILVAIARADGDIQPWEQTLLKQALLAIAPEFPMTLDQLLDAPATVDDLLARITTPDLQQTTYNEAIAFAQLDGITPAEHRLLERIRSAFKLQPMPSGLATSHAHTSDSAIDWSSTALSGRSLILGMRRIVEHSHRARELVLDYAIGAAIIGLIPLSISHLWVWQILAIALLLIKMMRDVGDYWGFPKGRDMFSVIGNLFGGMGALGITLMAWLTLFLIGLLIPVIRSLALAAAFFTLTWTLGQVTNQFYMSSSRLDVTSLRRASERMQQQGRSPWQSLLAHVKNTLNPNSKL